MQIFSRVKTVFYLAKNHGFTTILKTCYKYFLKCLITQKKVCEIKSDNLYHRLEYFHNGKKYIIVWKPNSYKNTPKILGVTDEEGNDVTEDVNKFLGPTKDFHTLDITPSIMGYKTLNFELLFLGTKTFKDYEIINL